MGSHDLTLLAGLVVTGFTLVFSNNIICFVTEVHNAAKGELQRGMTLQEDPCMCSAVRLGGFNSQTPLQTKWTPLYPRSLFLSEDTREIRAQFECPVRCIRSVQLGIEDGTIPDANLSASSNFINKQSSLASKASHGRLNMELVPGGYGAWLPHHEDTHPWIEVDLGRNWRVSGVITQGMNKGSFWVTKYNVAYNRLPALRKRLVVQDSKGNNMTFFGNVDIDTPVTNMFYKAVVAAQVRIVPVEWQLYNPAVRFELLGCALDAVMY